MMRTFVAAFAVAGLGLSLSSCAGGGYESPTAATSSTASVPTNAVVINVVGINGAQSFSPNPGSVPSGQLVVWHNVDSITHRVVLNDGELDTGNILAGGFSSPMALVTPGPYHCTIHPEMVGTLTHQGFQESVLADLKALGGA
jgi:plastocyanin